MNYEKIDTLNIFCKEKDESEKQLSNEQIKYITTPLVTSPMRKHNSKNKKNYSFTILSELQINYL
ncbi:MAG: hypothetical protein A2X61_16620 [Ignavibacteria bacterium GWB2_35_12]|nr:MAG: hypothetical protein A2X63_14145 [Ignavibacteria bacterium GWA2_35_8]OGU37892.1 MAG: hypothetical protein A2X61_16620 [Ignavibacteria bacterium GWB2_35_12]OGU85813.1 MAG: hypothetical protein A2220_02270 [Ignavibacteria bacterium RIFOXYA2_FULL_35_10]OGV19676.1 MAG: hypothetical protein A2475_10030 [Ignavibacteria bacterium RIFOXYC2_FULL_35_21]